jgi:hypothetical protein
LGQVTVPPQEGGIAKGHEATETGFAYAPVSQAHGHNHIAKGGGEVRMKTGLAVSGPQITRNGISHSRKDDGPQIDM